MPFLRPRPFLPAVFLGLLLLAGLAHAQALTVAAGAGYKRPLNELGQAFEKATGTPLQAFYGNMGQVMAQARENPAVAVVFGDRSFLEATDKVQFARYLGLGHGRLVLAWPKGSPVHGSDDLAAPTVTRVALPDTRQAVYGKAASQFLDRHGLTQALGDRLLMVATVPQVSAYLLSGEVDAGFLNLTDLLAIREKLGGYVEIDAADYTPIEIVGGVLDGHQQDPQVAALEHFLASAQAREILARHGL